MYSKHTKVFLVTFWASARWLGLPQPRIPLAPDSTKTNGLLGGFNVFFSSPQWSSKICQNTQKHLNNKEKTVLNLEIINFLSWFLFWNWINFPKIERTQKKQKEKTDTHHTLILLMEDIRPVEVGSLSHYLQGFIHPRWCKISSINSITTQKSWSVSLRRLHLEVQGQPLSFKAEIIDLITGETVGQFLLWWLKSCTSWYGNYPIVYRVLYIPGGAGFQPSTVWLRYNYTSQYGDGYKSTFAPSEPLFFFSRIFLSSLESLEKKLFLAPASHALDTADPMPKAWQRVMETNTRSVAVMVKPQKPNRRDMFELFSREFSLSNTDVWEVVACLIAARWKIWSDGWSLIGINSNGMASKKETFRTQTLFGSCPHFLIALATLCA